MDKFEVGLILGLTSVLIGILIVGYAPFSPFSPFKGVWKEEINIHEEVGKLDNYSIYTYDWDEWSRQMGDAGGNFTEMNTWEEFKASLEHRDITSLMLDEENRVVWYRPPLTSQIIYFEY